MLTEQVVAETQLSMEAVPAGQAMPDWLISSLAEGKRLMIIHPSEHCRKQSIERLHELGAGKAVDPSHHLTINRLIGILHVDLRLPVLLSDDGILFEKTHRALSAEASGETFVGLLSNPKHKWSRSRTRRLLSLYKELTKLKRPWDWQEDPGARICDKVLQAMESKLQATHPLRLKRTVWQALKETEKIPFTISDVEGIIMLDHPSNISEVEIEIIREIDLYFNQISTNKKLKALVTAGPTREYLDPIRFISNESSGKQGYALANSFKEYGFETTLISGPTKLEDINGINMIKVKSGEEMFNEVVKNLPADVAVFSAAVSDFKINNFSSKKIKKDRDFNFKFEKNIDILAHISKHNSLRPKLTIGFAAETNDIEKNSIKKLNDKRCDWIISNDVSRNDIGFNADFNQISIFYKDQSSEHLDKMGKSVVADEIVKRVLNKLN